MTTLAVRATGLSKQYRLNGGRRGHHTLRDQLATTFRALWRTRPPTTRDEKHFWALRDVSLDVQQGEIVGFVGRNGAGKSTLLKILSRITQPTEGRVEIFGRVGSLLEVGTGFHPELTGRENVYFSGAVLGMSKQEIDRNFDEIVAFAEVDRFIDIPVKRYSSGMYVRLAFAVAAHLESEILIVDEVLAVGDAAFQKKCLGKMGNVAKQGRTVLFVSHNMGAVSRLCHRALLLTQGRLDMVGPVGDVVAAYVNHGSEGGGERRWVAADAPGTGKLRLRAIRMRNSDRSVSATFDIQRPIYVEIEYEVLKEFAPVRVGFRLIAGDGSVVFTSVDSADKAWATRPRPVGTYVSSCQVPGNLLNEGIYGLTVSADIPFTEVLLLEENVLSFQVEQTGGVSGGMPERWLGVICPQLSWHVERIEETDRSHSPVAP